MHQRWIFGNGSDLNRWRTKSVGGFWQEPKVTDVVVAFGSWIRSEPFAARWLGTWLAAESNKCWYGESHGIPNMAFLWELIPDPHVQHPLETMVK